LEKVVVAKHEIREMLLIALLSEGHILIEGLPGTAKTLLAKTFAQVISGQYKEYNSPPTCYPQT
jgi:MoxR-like ATPase